jgi:hypothetical protein
MRKKKWKPSYEKKGDFLDEKISEYKNVAIFALLLTERCLSGRKDLFAK